MTIRLTESRIPQGFSAGDLGEAAVDNAEQVKFALVSYLTSPIALGSTNHYVVLVQGEGPENSSNITYQWTLSPGQSGETEQEATAEGAFRLDASRIGNFVITVNVMKGDTEVAVLSLAQRVVEPNSGLEQLIAGTGMLKHLGLDSSIGSLGGKPRASRELINDLRRYVLDAVNKPETDSNTTVGVDLPARFLAAVVYAEICRVDAAGFMGREAELEAAAAELNGDFSLARGLAGMKNALGVCQIKPQTLAMVVGPDLESTYTEWVDLPVEFERRSATNERIENNLNKLDHSKDVKLDLFNLLRFPKSNILMCARLLRKLATRDGRWPEATRIDLAQSPSNLEIVATEFKVGGTKSTLPSSQESAEAV